jgi:hypothetical protein
MDDLDREIEEAARLARRKVLRRRLATLAGTATLLIVGVVGSIIVFKLFPEPDVNELDTYRQDMSVGRDEPGPTMLVEGLVAQQRDRNRTRWKIAPVIAVAFAAAIFVSKRLKPED